ncbi:bile acid:sodium symporter family protein [Domibacillus sp. PGB-M46]|uniref:bile acid:sodium symporter family protein n=1 Tax=Domibacillus sp. PGB-M46 TaxID=2910255 RepID=UPI001F5900C6|nr:bile acid:sodium symporter family protein [Domibacillus sp. PGB-M46]MCI2255971.1 bile acid:sodium symporter family protein [Domibacillus sp. PGB-M46]
MLRVMNMFLTRWMPLLTPVSVLAGVLLAEWIHSWVFIVPWVFAFMTFTGSLNSNFRMLHHTMTHPFPVFLALVILHMITPLFAWTAGHLLFPDDPLIVTGFTLALVIPTGITSVIWVTMYRGSVPLALVIILLDTILSPIVVPFSMSVLAGSKVEMDVFEMMSGLFWMIVLPSLLGMLVNEWVKSEKASQISQTLSPFSKLSLPLVIAINSAVVAPYLRDIDLKFVQILTTILFVVLCGYLLSWALAVACRQPHETIVTLIYTGGMRNISAGAVIAVNFFPPQAAVPVVVCMLFQQMLAAFHGFLLKRVYPREVRA